MNKAYTELQHIEKLSPEQVKFDIFILFHLCGDLMQPLHVGYGYEMGGNTYQVQYNGKGTNLHSIWDSRIIESQGITLASLQNFLQLLKPLTPQKLRTDPVNFMEGLKASREALSTVYNLKSRKIDEWILRTIVYHLFQWIVYQCFSPKFTSYYEGTLDYFSPKFTTTDALGVTLRHKVSHFIQQDLLLAFVHGIAL